jgi:glycosyltransferase involved in cell wall biosynthesis
MRWKATVVVPTYNAVRELNLVLAGLARQTLVPVEVLIADDGSTDSTRALIDEWRPHFPCPLRHFHHADEGFRKARIVNVAVRNATGDYLCLLDGDCIPHRHWVKDHLSSAGANRVLCGRRLRLGPDASDRVTRDVVEAGKLEGWRSKAVQGPGTKNRGLGLRLPMAIAWCYRIRRRRLMGCNFSLPLALMHEVNGYDEDFNEFGGEDYDLGLRLENAGENLTPFPNRGCVFHLYHAMRKSSDGLRLLRKEKQAQGRTRCDNGLDGHGAA